MRHSNDLYTNLKTLDEKDCFEDENTFGLALHQILTTVQKEWDDYNSELEYKKVFLKAHCNHLALTLREQNPAIQTRRTPETTSETFTLTHRG